MPPSLTFAVSQPITMDLALDIGNSFTKYAFFEDNDISASGNLPEFSLDRIKKLLAEFPEIQRTIVSSVKEPDRPALDFLDSNTSLLLLSSTTKLPFANRYKTPETLGRDRIAAVAGAATLFPGRHVLVIDAGTCITYDILTANNTYLGGAISPGIRMRYQALHTFTDKLPFIEATASAPELTGNSTEASIRSGVQTAVLLEVDATINAYKQQYDPLQVVVTGGDANYFDKYLKNNIFAAPNLVLTGLKRILDFNEGS